MSIEGDHGPHLLPMQAREPVVIASERKQTLESSILIVVLTRAELHERISWPGAEKP